MASVSLVGQQPSPHRLDSEPLFLKLSSTKKNNVSPLKSPWEKMVLARSPAEETRTAAFSPGPAEETMTGGLVMLAERCGAPMVTDAPRSPHQSEDGVTTGTQERRTCTSTTESKSNRDDAGVTRRKDSFKESGTGVMRSGSKQKRSHRHRDCRHRHGEHHTISLEDTPVREGVGPPLERLTQGRTGVVKLARTEPHRREAWTIFTQDMDPRVRTERGEGHRFEAKPVKRDWCDACSRQINAQLLQCQNCSYTCHLECERSVRLDCNQRDRETEESPTNHCSSTRLQHKQKEPKEEEARGTPQLTEEEVHARIEEYNAQVSNHGMNLAADGSYTGFIKVHLRLSRPVTVQAVEKAGSEGVFQLTGSHNLVPSEEQDETDCGNTEKRTSFYLPRDYVTHLHISSLNTTEQVIKGLLKKFEVQDNPRKFALYKQTHRDGQDLFEKLPLSEHPLPLRLIAGPDTEQLSFVFKENETEEVEWHAFSVPELQNFLVILEKEEVDRIRAVEQKYALYREKLQQALQQHDP